MFDIFWMNLKDILEEIADFSLPWTCPVPVQVTD